ncbi:hypothetical protein BC739_009254 [Kutzneria viridogrisea]|uniref:Uncharacterized protein n=1 Tax=Kutzneria viridogrisea TaxID=47990 RepID=A0ABR6BZ81_9PSEU|nr:hypothetical protein [Kutzneria viridogrisea]
MAHRRVRGWASRRSSIVGSVSAVFGKIASTVALSSRPAAPATSGSRMAPSR